jgi:PhnB protein
MRTVPYLTFAGNAREAMMFYQKCLGGKLVFQEIGKTPLAKQMPAKMKKTILHASLTKKDFMIMATDMVGDDGLLKGNSISIALNCDTEKELRSIYEKLSKGGKRKHIIEKTFFGSLLADLADRYGNTWLLYYKSKTKKT